MTSHFTRRQFVRDGAGVVAAGLAGARLPAAQPQPACILENRFLKLALGTDGRCLQFLDKQNGRDYLAGGRPSFAGIRKEGKQYPATAATLAEGLWRIAFGLSGVQVVLRPKVLENYLVVEVVSVAGTSIEEVVFVDIPLALKGVPDEPFAACALALNLKTNVTEIPQPGSRLRASCYPQLGFPGAAVALVGCPQNQLRKILQEAVTAAPELPHSSLGGPWALDRALNRGSYLFNFDGITEKTAPAWIDLAVKLGMKQIDFHGGSSFRFGDCRPNPSLYPQGRASLKAAIDQLHAAGLAAGLHTYAFFIARDCPWVAPVPDRRLASDAVFTLASDLDPRTTTVPVVESTGKMSTITGFFVRNSITLRLEDELIVYQGVGKEPPFTFTGCQRGAHGTRAAGHPRGAKVYHLKECFGLFVPDPETTLFAEVAARTAETFNECGFDMMYLDALDGSDILDPHLGGALAWHYGGRFVYEICQRLRRPVLMEMSTFHHHLWCVRSRLAAWDHPNRAYKKFVDLHCADNENSRRLFLPGELGWWALKNWTGAQAEPTFADDIEYLMGKCLGTDTGFALMGIDPTTAANTPALPRLGAIVKRYEDLRHSGKVPETIKAQLRRPGSEFTLTGSANAGWQFRPVEYVRRLVESGEGPANTWRVRNPFGRQSLRLRIEALLSGGAYESTGNPVLADFQSEKDFPVRQAQGGVTGTWQPSPQQVKSGSVSGRFTLTSTHPTPRAAWMQFQKQFTPPLNLNNHQGLGVWVYGDGQGAVLNLQLRSPQHIVGGIADHYLVLDFRGWRYFDLIEPEGDRYADYSWPYGDIYSIYRESVHFPQIETLGVWFNHLPPGKKVTCYLSPIKALPLVGVKLNCASIKVGHSRMVFPVEIETGSYLECHSPTDCRLFGPRGEPIRAVKPEGAIPLLEVGDNEIHFECQTPSGQKCRARVTVILEGEPLKA